MPTSSAAVLPPERRVKLTHRTYFRSLWPRILSPCTVPIRVENRSILKGPRGMWKCGGRNLCSYFFTSLPCMPDNAPKCVSHESRLQHRPESHTPGTWYHTDRHEQVKRVTYKANVFSWDPRAGASSEICLDQPPAFKMANNSQAFP